VNGTEREDAALKIKMILPVPIPPEALAAFEAQVPVSLQRPDLQIDFCAAKGGGKILDSYYEMALADAFVLEAGLFAESEGYDAVCINSMSDSGLSALRSRLNIPVVGPGSSVFSHGRDAGSSILCGHNVGSLEASLPKGGAGARDAESTGVDRIPLTRDLTLRNYWQVKRRWSLQSLSLPRAER